VPETAQNAGPASLEFVCAGERCDAFVLSLLGYGEMQPALPCKAGSGTPLASITAGGVRFGRVLLAITLRAMPEQITDTDTETAAGEPGADGPAPASPYRETHGRFPVPVDIRSMSLLTIAVLGTVFMMHWASAVLIPLMLGVVLSYAFGPIVDRMERYARLPRAAASALLVITVLAVTAFGAYSLADETAQFVETLPRMTAKLRQAVREQRKHSETPIETVQKAATQLEQAAKESAPPPAVERGVTRVQIEKPAFVLKDYLLTLTPSLLALAGQLMVVVFITYFLLASGNRFRSKMVRLAGPRLYQKKITVQALNEITEQIQRYLLIQGVISVVVGVITWLAFWAIGVEHAEIWGVLGCVLNLVPYIGALVFTVAASLAAFLQFGDFEMTLLVVGFSTVLHTLSGNWFTPWLTGRANRMNPVAVFIGLLAFGWLWGFWGLLLGVPILLIIKTVCEHVEDFRAVGEMLGE
jgi:predicted PurR-regulated permease PerM